MKTNTFFDRMKNKSIDGLISNRLKSHYNLSPAAAETITNDIVIIRNIFNQPQRAEGQIIYHAVKLGQPPSKRIRDCELVGIKLTVLDHKADAQYLKTYGLKALSKRIMQRITKETYEQGASLSTEDISLILRISEKTVKRYKKELKASGESVILRGDIADMGPSSCHRSQTVKLFLQGYSETHISKIISHNLENVENYIRDFLRVSILIKEDYSLSIITRLTKLSKGKVNDIYDLYRKLFDDNFYKPSLEKVLEIYQLSRHFKKKIEVTR